MKRAYGFTIVELLIVIVIVAILAAISFVVYSGAQDRARESVVYSDFTNIKKKLNLYKAEHGHYPQVKSEIIDAGLSVTGSVYATSPDSYEGGWRNVVYCINTDTDVFAFSGRIEGSLRQYYITSETGVQLHPSRMATNQTCDIINAALDSRVWTYAIEHTAGNWVGDDWLSY